MIQDKDTIQYFYYLGFDDLLPHLFFVRESQVIREGSVAPSAVAVIDTAIKQGKLPVLNLSGNPTVIEDFLPDFYQHFDPSQFFVLSPDAGGAYADQPNVEYWPHCLLMQQCADVGKYTENFKKKYRISALMRQTRLHRLHLWQAIKSVATDQDVVVANKTQEQNIPIDVRQCYQAMLWANELPWYTSKDFYDLERNLGFGFIYTAINHPAYQACVNITNESWSEHRPIFLSEKTWKAYASACLVVNYGSAQVPDTLKRWGFEIWADYDFCVEYQDKIPKIVELFQRTDIFDLYRKNMDMVAHNQRLATSWHVARKMAMPAIEKLQNLL